MLWDRKKRETDLERELRSHLEAEAEESGSDLARARRALGNTTSIQEATRESWGYAWFERLIGDLRYGCRVLKNSPGVSAVVILTAALGIGANTSIFSVVHSVLLHPLPYRDAERLVTPSHFMKDFLMQAIGDYQYGAWRDQATVFDGMAAYTGRRFTITGNGDAEQLRAKQVTPSFLKTLGMAPLIGRDFTAADAAPRGGGTAALISHSLWTRRFQGDPSILSRGMTLDGKAYRVLGVLPPQFEFPENSDVSVLVAFSEPGPQPNGAVYFYNVIARLKPGVTIARAEADLHVIDERLRAANPRSFERLRSGSGTRLTSVHERIVGNVKPALLVLSGAVGLVLLIVCLNICNLLLARGIARQREMAVRMALGAGRARVVRQLLTEGMLLASAGGLAGLLLAIQGVKLLRAIAPEGVPHLANAHISGTVLAFSIAVTVAAGILFGLAPARGAMKADPETVLKQTARAASGGRGQRRVESLLVVCETAFALMLLAGAGLLIRTFAGLTAIAPGFQPEHVTTVELSLPSGKYRTADRRRAFLDAAIEKAKTAPGVDAAGLVACLPYGGFVLSSNAEIEGRPKPSDDGENVAANFVSGDYFKTMGIPVLEGRAIDASDQMGRPLVAVINQTAARRLFPGVSPIGAHVKLGGVTEWLEIVGVVGNVKQGGLASEPRSEMILPVSQSENGASAQTIVVRSTADPRVLGPWLRGQLAELDRDLPPPEVKTMRVRMASLMASQVFVMRLLALFAAMAITLAAIGIYGVLAYSVERRSHEMGIRLALGARPAHLMGLVMGRGVRLAIGGAVLGSAGGLALTRYLKTLLYGVTPHDPATLAAGSAMVVIVALGAAYLPARRAVKQDAVGTLRAE